ncbi:MAG: hypothetical protein HUJ92_08250 [Bacteroidales bacterium]|nr:hypothetical protein [Bacteroidales bacterium]
MKSARIFKNEVFCGILTEDEEGYHLGKSTEQTEWLCFLPAAGNVSAT